MKFRSLQYYINEAFVNLFRNRLMSLASIITVFSCIFILSFSYCVAINIDYMLEQMESSLNLSVYVDDDIDETQVTALLHEIEKIPNVASVRYISKEEALKIFSEQLGDSSSALAGLENDNPLPRSFVIGVDDVKNQELVMEQLETLKSKGISEIQYDQNIINIITTVNTAIRVVSIIMIIILIIISVVIITNTIRITVNSRRTEISIMKYIGATDWFIRWPFIIEGILIGLIGALIPVIICWIGYNGAIEAVYDQLKMLQNLVSFKSTVSIFTVLLPLALALGIGIGVFGSVNSIRKHLQV